MLAQMEAAPNLAVKDMQKARRFYRDVLGLEAVSEEGEDLTVFRAGGLRILVYRSDYAGTNEATAMTWFTPDVDGLVRELRGKGVTFEHYDLPETEREGDVHVTGDLRLAWFKDPDGNILALASS